MFIEIDWRGRVGIREELFPKVEGGKKKIFIKSIRIVFSCVCVY
jgi:hypothetical protein